MCASWQAYAGKRPSSQPKCISFIVWGWERAQITLRTFYGQIVKSYVAATCYERLSDNQSEGLTGLSRSKVEYRLALHSEIVSALRRRVFERLRDLAVLVGGVGAHQPPVIIGLSWPMGWAEIYSG